LIEFSQEGGSSEEEVEQQYGEALIPEKNGIQEYAFRKKVMQLPQYSGLQQAPAVTDSCDWAAMLMRMYMMWAEKMVIKSKN